MWNIINPSKASSLGHKLCKQLLLIPLIHVCWGFQHGVLRVQFSIVSVRSEKRICTSPRLSEVSTKRCLWNNSNVRLTDDGPLSSSQGRLSSASSFHASLLLSRRSMVWCPWLRVRRWCLKLLNTSDLPRSKPLVRVALPASLSARSFPFSPAYPGQYMHTLSNRQSQTGTGCRVFRDTFLVLSTQYDVTDRAVRIYLRHVVWQPA